MFTNCSSCVNSKSIERHPKEDCIIETKEEISLGFPTAGSYCRFYKNKSIYNKEGIPKDKWKSLTDN